MQASQIGEMLIGFGQFSAAIPTGANTKTLKTGIGRLCRVSITTAGTASFSIFDNTTGSGTALFIGPATTSQGQIIDIMMPAQLGITVVNQASGPAFTVSFD
jgi:hypothetical protein